MRAARQTRRCPLVTWPACDASRAPVTPLPAGDLAGVRHELRAGDAAAPCGPACHGTRLPAAIDGACVRFGHV